MQFQFFLVCMNYLKDPPIVVRSSSKSKKYTEIFFSAVASKVVNCQLNLKLWHENEHD